MKTFTRSNSRRRLVAVLLGLVMCLSLCAWLVEAASRKQPVMSFIQEESAEVTLKLTADGFAPATLTRSAGRFMLSIDNKTEVQALTLRLSSEDGSLLREIKVPANTLDWSELIDLAVGQYTLIEAQHPQRVCHITVQ